MTYDHDHLLKVRRFLEQPYLPDRIVSRAGTELEFFVISGDMPYESIVEEFEAQDPDSDWGLREWIAEGAFYPGFVLVARLPGDRRPAGFLTFDTRVYVHDFGGNGSSISVCIVPETVYVSPDFRRSGVGSAFAEVLSEQVPWILDRLRDASTDTLRNLRPGRINFAMEAECVSEEGYRFVRKAFSGCATALAAGESIEDWPRPSSFTDNINYCGFDEERNMGIASQGSLGF